MTSLPSSNSLNRIAVIGCGHVGSTSAYALMTGGLAREIVLLDQEQKHAEGEAMDIQHAVPLSHPVSVFAGDYKDAAQSSVVVLAAGVGGRPGESRFDLLERNAVVIRECVEGLMRENFNGLLLMTAKKRWRK